MEYSKDFNPSAPVAELRISCPDKSKTVNSPYYLVNIQLRERSFENQIVVAGNEMLLGRDITTGHLLKDPERVIKICDAPKEVDADVDVVRKMLKGLL